MTPAMRLRLEQLAAERKTTLSGAVRSAVLEATATEHGIPSQEELLGLLSEAAHAGSVPAMKELMTYYERQSSGRQSFGREPGPNPLDRFDELAARRDH